MACACLLSVNVHCGNQVTSYFAPSSRFGQPEELQQLVDAAHGYGLLVLFELVHSHASANSREGLNRFDGSAAGYFLRGDAGWHQVWGSRLFDFGRAEVLLDIPTLTLTLAQPWP